MYGFVMNNDPDNGPERFLYFPVFFISLLFLVMLLNGYLFSLLDS